MVAGQAEIRCNENRASAAHWARFTARSQPAPEENRFRQLLKNNPEHTVEMLAKAESFYRNYYDRLEDLASCNW